MSGDDHSRVPIRSYRLVFRLERRIFEIDRFRLPFPYGVEVRGVVYGGVVYAILLILSRLPLIGQVLALMPMPVRWGLLPLGVVVAMLKLRIDGRAPHRVLAAAARWSVAPKHLAGLRPCPEAGHQFVPLRELWMRPDWRAPRYRKALIHGPAQVTLRYPATVDVRRRPSRQFRHPQQQLEAGQIPARELIVRADATEPMFVGKTIHIPAGGRVRFR